MVEMVGETFTLGPSDYFYHAHEVYAKTSPNNHWLIVLAIALIGYVITFKWAVPVTVFVLFVVFWRIYHYYDKRAVKTFNQS